MKRVSVVAGVMVLFASTLTVVADDAKTTQPQSQVCTLNVSGMTCAGCEAAVRMAAKSVVGVTDVKASYERSSAEITYDPAKTSPGAIATVITAKSGFTAEPTQKAVKK